MSRTFDVTLPLPLISGQPIRIREKNITDLTDILEGFHIPDGFVLNTTYSSCPSAFSRVG